MHDDGIATGVAIVLICLMLVVLVLLVVRQ